MLEKLFEIHNSVLETAPHGFSRYLNRMIDWKEHTLCITGARGTGKTTILLQYAAKHFPHGRECLYISADNVLVSADGLFAVAGEFFKYGGKVLLVDEIHKYDSWQVELKNIIDTYKDRKVFVSGSSSLALKTGKADLSRRVPYYELRGLSFREYLNLTKGLSIKPVTLDDILKNHHDIASALLKHGPILHFFNEYLEKGYYPFIVEGAQTYLQKVMNTIEKVYYEDIATIGKIKRTNMTCLKKILWIIATSSPFLLNVERLSNDTGISREYINLYLEYLEDAGLIVSVYRSAKGYALARKPQKIFVENPNLLYALCDSLRSEGAVGAVRETFFVNQLTQGHKVAVGEKGDFMVDNKFYFEIGGKDKKFTQLGGATQGYVAADRIEMGFGNKIPLYVFGMLY